MTIYFKTKSYLSLNFTKELFMHNYNPFFKDLKLLKLPNIFFLITRNELPNKLRLEKVKDFFRKHDLTNFLKLNSFLSKQFLQTYKNEF